MDEELRQKNSRVLAVVFYFFMTFIGSALLMIVFGAVYAKIRNLSFMQLYESLTATDFDGFSDEMKKAYSIVTGVGNMLGYLLMFIGITFWMRFDLKKDFIDGKNRKGFLCLFAVISAILFYGITFVIDNYCIAPFVGVSENQKTIELSIANGGAVWMFFAVVVFAPVVEELIYRKAIFKFLEKKNIVFSYVVSVFCFTLPHMLTTNFNPPSEWFLLCIPYFVSGILLAGIYHLSGKNMFVSWFVHFMNNLLAFILLFV